MSTLEELLVVGQKLTIFYGEKSSSNKAIEIRAIVDEDYFICREWLRSRQGWYYYSIERCVLEMYYKQDVLRKRK